MERIRRLRVHARRVQRRSAKLEYRDVETDYAISKRIDFYLEGLYQNVHGAPAGSVLSHAMINTVSPSSSDTQAVVVVGMRHAF